MQSKLESSTKNEAMLNLVLAALEAKATINIPFIGNLLRESVYLFLVCIMLGCNNPDTIFFIHNMFQPRK